MSFTSWLRGLQSALAPSPVACTRRRQRSLRAATHRPRLEVLEDLCLLSTFTVLNLNDSGPDSLRAAITAANTNPGADTIDFATTGTIALTSGQLDITDSLTISGPGASDLIVSGENFSRVFAVAGNPTVVIAGLTIGNGWTVGSPGAGISMTGGTLTLANCSVIGNSAFGSGGGGEGVGGGLYVAGGVVYVNQSSFVGNHAVGGFGQYYGGYGGNAQGGGIFVGGGVVSVNQSTFTGNLAAGGTGGEGYFDTNGGDGGSAEGGGIFVGGGRLEVYQSTLSGNTAVGGMGGYYGGLDGPAEGGGLSTPLIEPPYTYLDSFTVAHTIDNYPDDIVGTYFLDGMPRLSIGDVTMTEGNDGTTNFSFTVTRVGPSDQAVSVDYATADGTATSPGDYTATFGTLTIPAGQTTRTIIVPMNGDRLGEPNETFFINLSNATNATITDGLGVGTIVDDEPRVNISGVSLQEGHAGTTAFNFTVTLSRVYVEPVVLTFATADGNATAGIDYQARNGTLVFTPSETSKTITVLGNGDRVGEYMWEVFFVDLSGAPNAVFINSRGGATILDDEPRISIDDVYKLERKRNQRTQFTFTVTLSVAYDQPVTVSFRTADGTARVSDGDYNARTGTLTFAPGQTSKTITIEVRGDNTREADETFNLELFGVSSNAYLADALGVGTIWNDD